MNDQDVWRNLSNEVVVFPSPLYLPAFPRNQGTDERRPDHSCIQYPVTTNSFSRSQQQFTNEIVMRTHRHVPVADAEVPHDPLDLRPILRSFQACPHVRVGHDLKTGRLSHVDVSRASVKDDTHASAEMSPKGAVLSLVGGQWWDPQKLGVRNEEA